MSPRRTRSGTNSIPELAKFVVLRRRQLGLTQQGLAERSGVGLRFVRELERGKGTVRVDKVNQVLSLFGHEAGAVASRREGDTHGA